MTSKLSHGDVMIIIRIEPMTMMTLRRACEALVPMAALIWVVSAVRRDITSAEWVWS